ncbi:unnamed protein product, partial [Ectocarpus sp. 4 AP-2014]
GFGLVYGRIAKIYAAGVMHRTRASCKDLLRAHSVSHLEVPSRWWQTRGLSTPRLEQRLQRPPGILVWYIVGQFVTNTESGNLTVSWQDCIYHLAPLAMSGMRERFNS